MELTYRKSTAFSPDQVAFKANPGKSGRVGSFAVDAHTRNFPNKRCESIFWTSHTPPDDDVPNFTSSSRRWENTLHGGMTGKPSQTVLVNPTALSAFKKTYEGMYNVPFDESTMFSDLNPHFMVATAPGVASKITDPEVRRFVQQFLPRPSSSGAGAAGGGAAAAEAGVAGGGAGAGMGAGAGAGVVGAAGAARASAGAGLRLYVSEDRDSPTSGGYLRMRRFEDEGTITTVYMYKKDARRVDPTPLHELKTNMQVHVNTVNKVGYNCYAERNVFPEITHDQSLWPPGEDGVYCRHLLNHNDESNRPWNDRHDSSLSSTV
jgi:hypothetical protein